MNDYRISLYRRHLTPETPFVPGPGHHAIWLSAGHVNVDDAAIEIGEGVSCAGPVRAEGPDAELLHFAVTGGKPANADDPIMCERFSWDTEHAILRLDQVSFPPHACAWRHTHPGPGIRCLIRGELEIRTDHGVQMMRRGDAWYEPANNPVQATAGAQDAAFVRAMILPLEYHGEPTLRLVDPDDASRPRLQQNRRFVDQRIHLSPA